MTDFDENVCPTPIYCKVNPCTGRCEPMPKHRSLADMRGMLMRENSTVPPEAAMARIGVTESPLATQVAGSHYKDLAIQPVEYIHANKLPFIERCVVKYITRWRVKGGVKDLEKARRFIDLLIELESRKP